MTDLELVRAVKDGDRGAFSELVKRHQKALLRMCLKWTRDLDVAEDVVQESFIKAYQKIHLFEERSSFKSWLFRIGINTANNRLRSDNTGSVNVDKIHVVIGAEAEKELVLRDVKKAVWDEVEKLPDRQKTALKLRIFDDLSFQEIAEQMECPYDTAKANYRHALMKLKVAFDGTDWFQTLLDQETEEAVKLKDYLLEVDQ